MKNKIAAHITDQQVSDFLKEIETSADRRRKGDETMLSLEEVKMAFKRHCLPSGANYFTAASSGPSMGTGLPRGKGLRSAILLSRGSGEVSNGTIRVRITPKSGTGGFGTKYS